jgi:hypothetical protein
MSNIIWNWKPLESVGEIKFGIHINELTERYNLHLLEKIYESDEWETYEIPENLTKVYVAKDHRVEDIGCFDNLYYNGKNLLNLTLDEVREILGSEDEVGEAVYNYYDEEPYEKIPVEFESLGLQLWFRGEVAVDAMVSGALDDE